MLAISAMRLDRLITLHLFASYAKLLNGHRNAGVPILMYHGIEPPDCKGHPYYETATSPARFALHMKFLEKNGYEPVDLDEALRTMALGQEGRKSVVITFDDGYRNFYTNALPILMDYGFRATVFLASGLIHERPLRHNGHEYLTWNEVRELHANGIRVGSHTVTHPTLYRVSGSEIEHEIRDSKQAIEDHIGKGVRNFSYPFAFPEHDQEFAAQIRELLRTHGYTCGVSTIIGTASRRHDRFILPRVPVNSHDDPQFFRAKLEGSYNWLHFFQYASKAVRGWKA